MRFQGTLFEKLGSYGTHVDAVFDVAWTTPEVLSVLGAADAVSKNEQQLWSAATYLEGARRGVAGLDVLHAVVLDCDCADVGELDRVCAYLHERGTAFIAYTSWSHGLSDKAHAGSGRTGPFDCFRIVVPYSRPVTPAEHAALVPALFGLEIPSDPPQYAAEVTGRWVTSANGAQRAAQPRGWDPIGARPAQAYYLPNARSTIDVEKGTPIDVEAVFARPTTARPTSKRVRPYQPPQPAALGLLGRVEEALTSIGAWLAPPNFAGWRRAACPACAPSGEQRSPSFVVRANGNGLDLHCHTGCSRGELLSALGLDRYESPAPSALRVLLEEQMARQIPSASVVMDEAMLRLVDDIRAGVASLRSTTIKYPAGTGKSYASARVMTELARAGQRVAYSTQEHVVAHETRSLLPADVRSVHLHSPLVQIGGGPVCARRDELKTRVFEFGVSLLGSICPKCPLRDGCAAYDEAKQRARDLPDASVVFVSHAGIRQMFNAEKGFDMRLIVDEMPGVFEHISVSRAELSQLTSPAHLSSLDALTRKTVSALALAWVVGCEPGKIHWSEGGELIGETLELCAEIGRARLREDVHPSPSERGLLKAADALVRLAAHRAQGGAVWGLYQGSRDEVGALVPDGAHDALVRHRGVLLSATPMLVALPGFELRECNVDDGARVRRVMVLVSARGSGALTGTYLDDDVWKRRERVDGEPPGIPWPVVERALIRAHAEAQRYPIKRVLFVTFKAVADAMRSRQGKWALLQNVEIAHYGALRGKNDWQQGAASECSVAYLFGTPRQAIMPTLIQLGLRADAADQAWADYAAGELTQAEGRLRLPRRTKSCTVVVEGDVAPSTWHYANVDEIVELVD